MPAAAPAIEFFRAGHCRHPACMACRGAGLRPARFPALAALIRCEGGPLLFDAGYAPRFFAATRPFPERLYRWATPVTLDDPPLAEQLRGRAVARLFLSHLHADHIAGLADFPGAEILCSRAARDFALGPGSRFAKTRQGLLPALLPPDFSHRVRFLEDLPRRDLPAGMRPFTQGRLVARDLFAIELPGHAAGHWGLLAGEFFLIADAAWTRANIEENRLPHPLAALVMHDRRAFLRTLGRLRELRRNNPGLRLIPSHCAETLRDLGVCP